MGCNNHTPSTTKLKPLNHEQKTAFMNILMQGKEVSPEMAKQTQYQKLSIVLCVLLHLVNRFRIQILKLKQCHHHYIRFLQYGVLLLLWHICSVCFGINCMNMSCEITFDLMKLVHLFQTVCVCVSSIAAESMCDWFLIECRV